MELWVKDVSIKGYADDTVSSVSDVNEDVIVSKLEADAERILRFMASNSLSANPQKTGFLLIKKNNATEKRDVKIDDKTIKEERCHRILGITVNNTLSWNDHVDGKGGLLNAVHQCLGALRRISHSVPQSSIPCIASAVVASKIRYGIAVYGQVRMNGSDPTSEASQKLQIALNDAMRICLGKRRRDRVYVTDLIEQTGMKTFNRMAVEDSMRLVWQAVHVESSPLSHIVNREGNDTNGRASRSRSRGDLQNRATTTLGQRNFPEPAVRLWNKSTQTLRDADSRLSAKREITRFANSLPL